MDIHHHVDTKMQKAMADHAKRMKSKGAMPTAKVSMMDEEAGEPMEKGPGMMAKKMAGMNGRKP